mmetsp:Transcript_25842/g.61367  ORF Transcript_25842/g.61367 Transcript_25842/m.61367 type:complete len:266 (-) Transcript_25842:16-813(-)
METPADEGGRRGSHCRPLEPNATSRRPCSSGFERGRPRGAQDPSRRSSSGVLSRGGRSVRLEGPLDGADPVPTRPRSLPGERRCRPSSRHSPRRPGGRRRESRGRGPPPLGHARRGEEGRDRRAASSGRARPPSSSTAASIPPGRSAAVANAAVARRGDGTSSSSRSAGRPSLDSAGREEQGRPPQRSEDESRSRGGRTRRRAAPRATCPPRGGPLANFRLGTGAERSPRIDRARRGGSRTLEAEEPQGDVSAGRSLQLFCPAGP